MSAFVGRLERGEHEAHDDAHSDQQREHQPKIRSLKSRDCGPEL
jgi:hypothetical protein